MSLETLVKPIQALLVLQILIYEFKELVLYTSSAIHEFGGGVEKL